VTKTAQAADRLVIIELMILRFRSRFVPVIAIS